MFRRIVDISLRHRWVVLVLALGVVLHGLYILSKEQLDVFPDFVQPQAVVQTESPGFTPEQVEMLVTRPIENALSGIVNVESVRSESIQGLSVVTVVFKDGTDIFHARQMLTERLSELTSELPVGLPSPKMEPLTSSTMDLLKFGFTSEKMQPMELRQFADWTVRPKLLSIQGVAAIKVFGGAVREIQIQFNSDRLHLFGLTLQEVLSAAQAATGIRGAGYVETSSQRLLIQTEGQVRTVSQIGDTVIVRRGTDSIRLRDVATVIDGVEPQFGDALINGKPGVLMTVTSQYGANTMDVTRRVESALEELRPTFESQGILYAPGLHRPANFIEHALHNIKYSLWVGVTLVAVVLFLFLLDLRTAFISFLSIPLSLLTAAIVLNCWGVTLNTMTLGGLAVAIGVVVDDAIIDVENILRRLRENRSLASPQSLFHVVLNASIEVRGAVVYATFIVALVFMPIVLLGGLSGKFFAPLGIAFILAIMASLIVALTVTPALCYLLLSRVPPHAEPFFLLWLKKFHGAVVQKASVYPKTLMTLTGLLLLATIGAVPFLKCEFLPDFREGHFVVQLTMAPGTSLVEMRRIGTRISQELLKISAIRSVEEQIGRSEGGEDTWGPYRGEMHIELKPAPEIDQTKTQEQIRAVMASFPGIQSEVLTFLGDRISETIAGETAPVVISIYGDDLDLLDSKALEVAKVLKTIPEASDIRVEASSNSPRMLVRLLPRRISELGFRPTDVLEMVETACQGTIVSKIYEGEKEFGIRVISDAASRTLPEQIANLQLVNAQGLQVPLKELAEVKLSSGRHAILHDGARRRQTVTCTPSNGDVVSFVKIAREKIAREVVLPGNTYIEFGGLADEQLMGQRDLALRSLAAAAGILLLLAMVFHDVRRVALVLFNVPFALLGGVWAVYVSGILTGDAPSLSLGTLVGFVTLFGITMRNSIMLISHYEHLVQEEGMPWGLACAIRGASERVTPILMTALVTGLALLPLAFGSGDAGREIEGPMAMVIIGGLLTSTILNLVVLPVLAFRYGKFKKTESANDADK